MNRRLLLLAAFVFAGAAELAPPARAQSRTPVPTAPPQAPLAQAPVAQAPAAIDPALAPFITNGTLLVMRASPASLDIDAVRQWLLAPASDKAANANAPAAPATDARLSQLVIDTEFQQVAPPVKKWLADFHAAGGQLVYGVAFMGDVNAVPGVLIVPLAEGANARAIEGLLVSGAPEGPASTPQLNAVVLHNAVVFGNAEQVEKMKVAKQVDRPLFAEGLQALGEVPFKMVFSPSVALEMVASTLLPEKLPDELGGGNPAAMVTQLRWAGLGAAPPPGAALKLMVQCTNDAGAAMYVQAWNAYLESIHNDANVRNFVPGVDDFVAALKPTVAGGLMSVDLNSQTLADVIRPQAIQFLQSITNVNRSDQSSSNERMLMLGIHQYGSLHGGQYPPSLDDVAQYLGGDKNLRIILTNPRNPQQSPGYVYVKPAAAQDQIADPGGVVVLYDGAGPGADGLVSVSYADGTSESISAGALQAKLKAQGAAPMQTPGGR